MLLNDIPQDALHLDEAQLLAAFDGDAICFDVFLDTLSEESKHKLLDAFRTSSSHLQKAPAFSFDSLEVARDVLGLVRITRRRIREYCAMYFNTDFMVDYLAKMDKLYAMLEYMRLRNRADYGKVNQSFSELQEQDFEVIDLINKRMRLIK